MITMAVDNICNSHGSLGTSLQRKPRRDWSLFNVTVLGFAFMLLFTAFETLSMVEQSVLEGAVQESNGTFTGSGYTSQAIIYTSFAAANWAVCVAPGCQC